MKKHQRLAEKTQNIISKGDHLHKFAAIHLSQSWSSLIENKCRVRDSSLLDLEN